MSKWVGSHPSQRRWYQVLGRAEPGAPSFLENLRAAGTVSAGRVLVHDVVANRVSAAIELDSGKMKISDLRADLLGGKHQGDWTVDFAAASPVYAGSGTLSGISLEKLAGAMHDAWISGTARGSYQVTASGGSSAAFWQTAEGRLQFEVRDGGLSHISLSGDEGGLQIGRWRGTGHLHSGKMEIEKSEIDSAGEMYEVSGSASLGRVLDLRVIGAQGKPVYRITGTLAEPRVVVSATPETQARLKP
jgi:hypothetical protein